MDAERIREALVESGGKVKEAAARLGVPRRTMDRWVTQSGARALVPVDRSRGGGRPHGCRPPPRVGLAPGSDPTNRVRVERECDGSGEFISLADSLGNLVTIKFSTGHNGSARGDGRGRLAEIVCSTGKESRGSCQTELVSAELQVSSAEERRRRTCLERAIMRVCGPVVAAKIEEEARKS